MQVKKLRIKQKWPFPHQDLVSSPAILLKHELKNIFSQLLKLLGFISFLMQSY